MIFNRDGQSGRSARHLVIVAGWLSTPPLHDLVERLEVSASFAVAKEGCYLQGRQLFRYCGGHKLIDARAVLPVIIRQKLL